MAPGATCVGSNHTQAGRGTDGWVLGQEVIVTLGRVIVSPYPLTLPLDLKKPLGRKLEGMCWEGALGSAVEGARAVGKQ